MRDDLLRIMDQQGWTSENAPVEEGDALHVHIAEKDALLYVFADEASAAVAIEHHTTLGAQLFIVPEPIETGDRWILVERPAGRHLTEVLTTNGEPGEGFRRTFRNSLGMACRKLHSTHTEPKYNGSEPSGRTFKTFNGYVAALLEYFSSELRRRALPETETQQLTAAVGEIRHELSSFHPRNPPSVLHGRICADHLWVDSSFEIVGLTGWHHAGALPRDAEFAYVLSISHLSSDDDSFARDFYHGYGAARTMDTQRRERFYRRLVAFQVLLGLKGPCARTHDELLELAIR